MKGGKSSSEVEVEVVLEEVPAAMEAEMEGLDVVMKLPQIALWNQRFNPLFMDFFIFLFFFFTS